MADAVRRLTGRGQPEVALGYRAGRGELSVRGGGMGRGTGADVYSRLERWRVGVRSRPLLFGLNLVLSPGHDALEMLQARRAIG